MQPGLCRVEEEINCAGGGWTGHRICAAGDEKRVSGLAEAVPFIYTFPLFIDISGKQEQSANA
jgi:hypothetical protein